MFKHYFEGIIGIANYPIFSLTVFFTFFTALIYWVIKADKKYLNHMENMPLDNSND